MRKRARERQTERKRERKREKEREKNEKKKREWERNTSTFMRSERGKLSLERTPGLITRTGTIVIKARSEVWAFAPDDIANATPAQRPANSATAHTARRRRRPASHPGADATCGAAP